MFEEEYKFKKPFSKRDFEEDFEQMKKDFENHKLTKKDLVG